MPANCVPSSWRRALRNHRHEIAVEAAEQGKSFVVVRVTKKGKRTVQSDVNGVSKFDRTKADDLAAYWNQLNPGSTYEVDEA